MIDPSIPTEGKDWQLTQGTIGHGHSPIYDPGDTEALTYNNPFGQTMERVWYSGKIVFALELGKVPVEPLMVKVAQEYQIVYSVKLDQAQRAISGQLAKVPGQLNIYDSVPGMPNYSPIWQFNYVVVPRNYVPNTLRSEMDCLNSGYRIYKSRDFEN